MRILYKTPHNIFFRRCFLVKKIVEDGNDLIVTHGIGGRIMTVIPLAGTILRYIGSIDK